MCFWMWSFPSFIWQSRLLCLVLGLSARWSSARGWVMFSLQEHEHRDAALQIPPRQTGLVMPRSSFSGSQRATSTHGQGDLRITVRASLSSVSPRASHSSSASHHLVFLDKPIESSDRAGPSISFGTPADDRISIAATEGKLGSGDDDSAVLSPSGRVALAESDPEPVSAAAKPVKHQGMRRHSDPTLGCTAFRVGSLCSTSLPHRGYISVAPLVPLVRSLGAWPVLPRPSRWLHQTRLHDSVCPASSLVQGHSVHRGVEQRCFCLACGNRGPACKGQNRAGPSSRDEVRVLQPLLHRTQDRWWVPTNLRPAHSESGPSILIDMKYTYFLFSILPWHIPFLRFAFDVELPGVFPAQEGGSN